MGQVRYGIVGAGWIAQEAFMPAVAKAGNSRMTAIVSGSPDRARALGDQYGIDTIVGYDGYDRLLTSDLIDAVYIALPNSQHADYAVRALRAGKHVVEKPLATTEAECAAIIDAAREGGAFVLTAYRLHHEPGTQETIRRIRAGEIGDPRIFSATFTGMISDGNHRLSAVHWGGPLQDIGVYCLNMARHAFGGEPVRVGAMAGHGHDDARFADVPESVAVTLMFPKGRIAQFVVSFNASDVDGYVISGTEGSIHADPAFRFEYTICPTLRRDGETQALDHPKVDHFAGMVAYFSDCVLTGTAPHSGPEEGLADVRVLLAVERAIRTGEVQDLAPFEVSGCLDPDMRRAIV